jgi:hypothetical protein
MTSTKRSFGMHPNLLFDVILRQAGTLQKALLEGVMNAIDAGATECRITLDTHSFTLQDDGRGFQSHQEIEDFFETFGTPHEEGDAVYGRFRMGRGQMMAFGRNIWRSRQFEMDVDIKNSGLDYALTEHADIFDGTRISAELYEPIAPSELERIKNELRKFVAWAQIPVTLNDDVLSRRPEEAKWDFEDDNAWYSLSADRSQLAVYNLGVLVNSFWSGRFGMGGTIVTKRQVEINFARNDIQSTCPVFRKIQDEIKKRAGVATKKKTKLNDAERDMLVRDFLAGEADIQEAAKLRVLTDVNGRSWPIDKLLSVGHQFGGKLIVVPRGDQMVETAQRRGIAFSIDEATLERFGATDGHAFLARIQSACNTMMQTMPRNALFTAKGVLVQRMARGFADHIEIVDRDYLSAFVSSDYIALTHKDLTADQKILLDAVSTANSVLVTALRRTGYEDREYTQRKVYLGTSETALAWTDGTSNIWVEAEHARLLRRGYPGAYQIALTLLHEHLHSGPDTGTHEHDHSFFQGFHDLSGHPADPVGVAATRMVKIFAARLRRHGKKVSAKLLEQDDADLVIEETLKTAEAQDA